MKRYLAIVVGIVWCGSVSFGQTTPKIKLEPFLRGLQSPVWVTHDGTERLFVVEQPGRVRLIKNGQLDTTPYLDMVSKVRFQGEMGLLCFVFHPQFATNGYVYVNYTRQLPPPPVTQAAAPPPPTTAPTTGRAGGRRGRGPQGQIQTIVSEFKVDPKSERIDPSTERIVMIINQPYANHNGGQLLFGPDGMLYIAMGDGGAANDPQNRAQNMSELLGKILRIDVSPREGYAVPKDNPFVDRSDARPEIWAQGVRNPWRLSFDRETGILYAGEVGQNLWEQVLVIQKGANHGWRIMEGTHPFMLVPNPPKFTYPIKEYSHTLGLSITGGYVYRGKQIPSLVGWYLYADYAKGQVWGLKYDPAANALTADAQLTQMPGQPSSFGEDLAGELYLCDHGRGLVFRIVEDK